MKKFLNSGVINCLSLKKLFYALLLILPLEGNAKSLEIVNSTYKYMYCHSVTQFTCKIAESLGIGINLGSLLESPVSAKIKQARYNNDYPDIIEKHFQTVRIPIKWSNHASLDQAATIDREFLDFVRSIIESFTSKKIYTIINVHHYNQLLNEELRINEYEVEEKVVLQRFYNIWKQLANEFSDVNKYLIFEILNEPRGQRIKQKNWNVIQNNTLKIIRKYSQRVVMLSPTYWNPTSNLNELILPEDKNIILSIHQYEPHDFTHQGLLWLPQWPKGVKCCNEDQKKAISSHLNFIVKWSIEKGIPVHLGEWGVNDNADIDSRINYISFMVNEMRNYKINWAYWEFDSKFGIYERDEKEFNRPLLEALTK